jgi:WD40 repeat protein
MRRSTNSHRLTIWFFASLAIIVFSTAAKADDAAPPDFNAKILPVFTRYCTGCHNAKDREGKLILESYADLLRGGKRGAEFVANHPENSRLLRVLTGDTQPSMPPKDNDPPKPEEVALLRAWIEAGAKGPSGASPDPTVLVIPKHAPTAPVRRAIQAVACSPDGRWIAVARYGAVELLASDTRAVVRTFGDLPGQVNDVAFSRDSAQLVAATGQAGLFGEARLWNVADGRMIRTFRGHRDSLYAVALSPDGRTLATGSYDQQIILWNVATGAQLRTLTGHSGAVFALAFHPGGRLLASASGDRTAKLWDTTTGERLETFGQPLEDQYTVAFSPDGTRLAAAGADHRIRIWKISATGKEGTNPQLMAQFADEQPLVKLIYSPDGHTLVTSSDDRLIKFWNADTLELVRKLEVQPDVAFALAFQPKTGALVVGRMDGSLAVYDSSDGKRTASIGRWITRLALDTARTFAATRQRIALAAALPLLAAVDSIPEQTESEPNDTPAQANLLKKLPVIVKGSLGAPGDADYFSFDAAAGQTLVFDVEARRNGSPAQTRLALFDSAGKLLRDQSEFDPASDPLLAYTFTKLGRYLLRLDDRTLAGGPKNTYRLTIGELPYVVACYPLSIAGHTATDVELIGFNLPANAKARVPSASPGETTVPLDAKLFRSRGPLKVLVSDLPEQLTGGPKGEPDDVPARASPMSAPGSANGRIRHRPPGAAPDAGYFRFESKAGQRWIIETEAARRGSPIDTRIDVLTADGRPIPRVLLQAVRDSFINFRGIDSEKGQPRLKNYEEMELNQYIYMRGEVCKLFQYPQGPDSDFFLYRDLAGRRRTYFDTTSTTHANFEPVFVVVPHAPGEKLADNGLPVFAVDYTNDDASDRSRGRDSWLSFAAPADGSYLVRVCDSRGEGGPRFLYRLTIRRPHSDFNIRVTDMNPTVNAGSGKRFKLQADRFDEFDGDIRLDMTGLPPGFAASTPLVIQAGHLEAVGVLSALAWAPQPTPENASSSKITATARIDGREVTKVVGSLGQIKLAAEPPLIARLEPMKSSDNATSSKALPVPQAAQHWVVLEPTSALSKAGATITKQADQSLLAGGVNPANDSYTVVATTDAKNIRAVRLEVLGDKSLPDGAPGRGDGNGNFVLSEFRLAAAPRNDFVKAVPVAFASVEADYAQPGQPASAMIDGNQATGWAIAAPGPNNKFPVARRGGDPAHVATFQLKQPVGFDRGTILTFTLDQLGNVPRHNLGRFRLSVLADDRPPLEFAPHEELVITPGVTTTYKLKVDRRGFKGQITFDVENLPHGVWVDNIGLSGILITPQENELTIYISSAPWVPQCDRLFFAVAKVAGDQATLPIMLHVRRPPTVTAQTPRR